jgi:RNA polymerase sigma-70 factor (ECF subfamily)
VFLQGRFEGAEWYDDHVTTNGENPLLSDSPAAWQRLIESAGPASLLMAIEQRMSALLRHRLSPEDIFQDALLHAWRDRHLCEWRGVKSFRSWLLCIIDNRIRDAADHEGALKRGGGRIDGSVSFEVGGDPDESGSAIIPEALISSTTPSRIAMYREQAAAMNEALAALPEDLRAVMRLRLIEQRTIEQVAADLGIGEAAARHRFRKGGEMYRRRLEAALLSRSARGGDSSTSNSPAHR